MNNTKNLCIIYADNDYIIEAIGESFKDNNTVNITCMFLDETAPEQIYKHITTQTVNSKNISEYFVANKFDLIVTSNSAQVFDRDIYETARFIKIHPSILPAFPEPEAVKNAYLAGVKVSGITIHTLEKDPKKNKIIAQYPILISNIMHFEEFREGIENLEKNITPIVISKLLEDKLFDFQDLFSNKKHSCQGNCGNCSGCG